MKLTEEQIKRKQWLEDNKCQEEGCYNFQERGYIYCTLHLHGFPEKMSNSDIILLNFKGEK